MNARDFYDKRIKEEPTIGSVQLMNEYSEQKQIANTKVRVHGEKLNEGKFEELARPMIKYLCEEFHPHVTAIITPTSAELLEGLKATGRIEDYIRD